MNKALLVAGREFFENVKTKGFWFGVMLVPILYTFMFLGPAWLEKAKSAKRYAVIDHSGWLLSHMETQLMISDLTTVFGEMAAAHAKGRGLSDLPEPLAEMGGYFSEMDSAQRRRMARNLVTGSGSEPSEASPQEARLLGHRQSLLDWWQGLSARDVKASFETTSKNRFIRSTSAPSDQETLNQMVIDEELFAYFIIGPDPVTGSQGSKYISHNLTDNDLLRWFSARVTEVVREQRLGQESIDATVAAWIQAPVHFEGRKLSASGEEEEASTQDMIRQWAPAAFVYLLWIAIFTIANMLLTSTIEEKSNRLIEVLLSSMSPIQLMVGKMSGIALTGLTVIGTWITCLLLGTLLVPRLLDVNMPFDLTVIVTDPIYLVSFGSYFILGYLLYGAILIGAGSIFNTLKEAQALMGPIMMILFIPLIMMVPIGQDPNGTMAKVCSYIPPLTPFVMMNRAAGPPTTSEYVVTTLLLLASVIVCLWAAAKIFRIGILLTGKPPKFREMLRWLRAPVGQVPESKEHASPSTRS